MAQAHALCRAQVILLAGIGLAWVANLFADITIHNPVSGARKSNTLQRSWMNPASLTWPTLR